MVYNVEHNIEKCIYVYTHVHTTYLHTLRESFFTLHLRHLFMVLGPENLKQVKGGGRVISLALVISRDRKPSSIIPVVNGALTGL